jgi:DNA-binding transcriptional LysR family regulator
LEDRLGVTLFERTNGGTHLTIIGQEFAEAATRILEETETISARIKRHSRGETGRLTIGVHASLSAGNLRATLAEHHRRFPDVETHLIDGSSEQLMADLADASVDIAFMLEGGPKWDDKSLSVWSERVVVAFPEEHALGANETVTWADLKNEPLLLPQRGPGSEILKLLADKIGCQSACRLVRHDVSLDRLLTLAGIGCGILLLLEGATGARYPGVVFREINEAEGPERMGLRACWKETNANPSLNPLLEILHERYPDFSSDPVFDA